MPDALPQYCPTPREADDLELLLSGALAPLTTFNEPDSLVTLDLPPDLKGAPLELVDPEGLPLARLDADGSLTALASPDFGPFRRLHLTPAEVREAYAGRTFVPVMDAITNPQLDALIDAGPLVFLALTGSGTPALSPVALLRATLEVANALGGDVVSVPLAAHGDLERDAELAARVVENYAGGDRVLALQEGGELVPDLKPIVAADRSAPDEVGLVIFFTGLSGSGKSTIARALMDRILESGTRTLTSLDGDVVRRNLSAGLTFSAADRETNIRRIGWVAAEIARHRGVAVCSPIAPFESTRADVRQMVDDARGAFFLVHVATPLEECERRDRKGLYAKARRGEIPEFTGISSPYEEPTDADVVVDTTGRSIEDCLDEVTSALASAGYLNLPSVEPVETSRAKSEPAQSPVELVETPAASTSDLDKLDQRGVEPVETPSVPEVPSASEASKGTGLSVLFVCTANICRSPYMELRARSMASEIAVASTTPLPDVRFSGAGTHGFDSAPMDETMAAELSTRGGSAQGFTSRPLTKALIEQADLILTAETTHRTFVLEELPGAFRKTFTLGQFAHLVGETRSDEAPGGRDLIAAISTRRGTADPSLDVADPYRRGSRAAEQAADRIDGLLRAVVPALLGSAKMP